MSRKLARPFSVVAPTRRIGCFGVSLLLLLLTIGPHLSAQSGGAKKTSIKIIYSALTASNGPVWVADDQGLFEKYGLDVQIVHGRGASPIQALAGGAVDLGHFAGASVISAISPAAIWFSSRRRPTTSCCRSGRAKIRRLRISRTWREKTSA